MNRQQFYRVADAKRAQRAKLWNAHLRIWMALTTEDLTPKGRTALLRLQTDVEAQLRAMGEVVEGQHA